MKRIVADNDLLERRKTRVEKDKTIIDSVWLAEGYLEKPKREWGEVA